MTATFTAAPAVRTYALEAGDIVVVPQGHGAARFAVVEGVSDFTESSALGGGVRAVYGYDVDEPMRLVTFLAREDGAVPTVTTDAATQRYLGRFVGA